MRTADNELAGRVYKQLVFCVEQFLYFVWEALDDSGDEDLLHVAADGGEHRIVVGELVMLSGDDNAVDALGVMVFGVLHGDLRLGVGAEVGHFAALLADGGQLLYEAVGQLDGQRHVVVHLVAGITEHHALVACALVFGGRPFDTLVDVGRLAVDGGDDPARLEVELVVALVVADLLDGVAHHVVNGDVAFGLHLAGADHETGGCQRLACHFRFGILREKRVQ